MNRPRFPARSIHLALAAACVLSAWVGPTQATVVTLGPVPTALPNCPDPLLPGKCAVDTAAQVLGVVGNLSAVRIGQSGQGSLLIGDNANLIVNRPDLATGTPWVPDVVVGDNVGARASLVVRGSGRLDLTVPDTEPFRGGLIVGAFAAPALNPAQSTTLSILDGGRVNVQKPGGFGVGSAVFVGQGAGSNSSLVLDGGISGFGNQALGARLDTTGNLSIGRLGTGNVSLARNADVTARLVLMSTVLEGGISGHSTLAVGHNATVTAQGIYAGIGLGGVNGYDPNSTNHGTALISVRETGFINADIVLGKGGTLMGTGSVGGSVSNFGGTVRPGFSPGTLHLDGNYSDVGGHIEIEIGPNGSDFIHVAGDLSLHGTSIEFRFIDGFAPDAGFSYDFIDADGSVNLADLNFSFSGLQPGFLFSVPPPGPDGVLTFVARTAGTPLPEPALPALLAVAALAATAARRLASKRRTRPHSVG